jgi:hypothetical protein
VNKKTSAVAAFAAALGLCSTAFAGAKQDAPVVYWPGAFITVMYGSLGSARNSADTVQSIGCYTHGSGATCYATDARGQSGSCTTTNAAHLAAIHSMNNDAHLLFAWENGGDGHCEFVIVRNYSYLAPKVL